MATPQELFENLKEIFPGTTYRSFSRLCGMSESYYGSITSQGLAMSTHALIYLAELLEHKKVLMSEMTPRRLHQIQVVQNKIASEIARRATSIESGNLKVRKMLIAALAKVAAEHGAECYPLMPTMIFR
jgi:hypothetical protein